MTGKVNRLLGERFPVTYPNSYKQLADLKNKNNARLFPYSRHCMEIISIGMLQEVHLKFIQKASGAYFRERICGKKNLFLMLENISYQEQQTVIITASLTPTLPVVWNFLGCAESNPAVTCFPV